ncbi:MAG: hypothetical protein ACLFU0_07285 [Alphaproteobacteria bacterium]
MADGEQILLRRRETGDGFDVMYRPVPLGALLVGRDLDDAESFVGRTHDRDAVAHRVALARAWTGGNASASRRAACSVTSASTVNCSGAAPKTGGTSLVTMRNVDPSASR